MSNTKASIAHLIQQASDLLSSQGIKAAPMNDPQASDTSLTSVLSDAMALLETPNLLAEEPIRTIHHFSCTGGTLFSKCIAAMANTLVLNEVDLQSTMAPGANGQAAFTPTDMISLIRQGDPNVSPELISHLFLNNLDVLREAQWKIGRHIVLRDHTHSHFLIGEDIRPQPTLLETVATKFPTRSILTVRDPIDSWLSMTKQGWHQNFHPSTFDEYCRRYLCFLQKFHGIPIVRYEDLVTNPEETMTAVCEHLHLSYNPNFKELLGLFKFSGDSGRAAKTIAPRSRRPISEEEYAAMSNSPPYQAVSKQLGYEIKIR